jgi:hypothetical protein
MWFAVPLAVLVVLVAYEYRLRRPDQLILFEKGQTVRFRKSRWYPRHFTLAIPGTTYATELNFEATAKGGIPIVVKISLILAASREGINALVRVGGWNAKAVEKASKEYSTVLHGQVKEWTEKRGLEHLTSEGLGSQLSAQADVARQNFGLEVVSLTVQSIDPVDVTIAEALRQRESARILEETESQRQRARVAEAEARIQADDQIAHLEHALELKKSGLRRSQQDAEADLARRRTENELTRSRMRLEFDREEMTILKDNPQLLLLSPQAARLAEASQSLRNARTVVSLSPSDAEQGGKLAGLFQLFLDNYLNGTRPADKKK